MFIDTHCHLHDAKLPDTDKVVQSFLRDGVSLVIDMGCCAKTSEIGSVLAEKYPSVFFATGCHPSDAVGFDNREFDRISKLTTHEKCVAVGEIGLDYYWQPFDKKQQEYAFVKQIELAYESKLPISIHSREATADTLRILNENKSKLYYGGVMHCFSGSKEIAKEMLDLGLYISFAGPLTFKNAGKALEVASFVPKEFCLTETDSPYLAPHPLRGSINEPKNVGIITAFLANLKNIELTEFASIIMSNAKRLFKKLK